MYTSKQQLYYLEKKNIAPNNTYTFDKKTSHHLIKVLRHIKGASVIITNGEGMLAEGQITSEDSQASTVLIKKVTYIKKQTSITLGISLIQHKERWEWMLEKSVELGVTAIVPLRCKHTASYAPFKYERAEHIIRSAMLQSKSLWQPKLYPQTDIKVWLNKTNIDYGFIAHCDTAMKREKLTITQHPNANYGLLIGPEGDFDKNEIVQAEENNFKAISFGNKRLRTETAAIYGLSVITHQICN